MNRDEAIKSIRPQIQFLNPEQPLEQFQEILRQVLKLQNDVLLTLSLNFLENKYKDYQNRDLTIKDNLLYQSLKKDIPFKKMLIGTIVGFFTQDELAIYHTQEQEINKRLVEFIYKRLAKQIVKA
nr:hypothetical protein [Pseudopedobacter sp.]